MRDSIGGAVSIVIIVAFIVIVLSYLAFNVNYTKAFRMKNKIVATYEDYDGECTGVNDTSGGSNINTCFGAITDYASDVGYKPGELECRDGWQKAGSYYCYKEIPVKGTSCSNCVKEEEKKYYKIATKINIEIPIIKNIFNLQFFWVTGDTKTFTKVK